MVPGGGGARAGEVAEMVTGVMRASEGGSFFRNRSSISNLCPSTRQTPTTVFSSKPTVQTLDLARRTGVAMQVGGDGASVGRGRQVGCRIETCRFLIKKSSRGQES